VAPLINNAYWKITDMVIEDMDKTTHQEDYKFARRICEELRAGRPGAIEDVYHRYNRVFLYFLRNRIKGRASQRIGDLLNQFWEELLKSRAICGFEGRTSLQAFFLSRLNYRITDEWRRVERDKRYVSLAGSQGENRSDEGLLSEATTDSQAFFYKGRSNHNPTHQDGTAPPDPGNPPSPASVEDQVIIKERDQIIRKTLLDLAETDPMDAGRVKMHLEEMSYGDMAARELAEFHPDQETLKKREMAIKKQFTRSGTGSLAKFKKMLLRNLEQYGIDIDDLLE
jgi:DNA-directed RNA polymerase specialized sigma24 family protein